MMSSRLSIILHKRWIVLALIMLLAGGLRLHRIDAQSFWNDEGNSARLSERTIDLIVEGAKGDIHPPGYYLALHYWRAVLGQSEAALRGLSAACGVALVLFTYLVGRRLFSDSTIGLVAAALVAVNPFQVYYGQEARMYAMLALWTMASTWALILWWQSGDRQPRVMRLSLAAYVLTAVAGLYTHYAFPFVMFAHTLSLGFWLWNAGDKAGVVRRLQLWVLAQVGVAVLYLPWLPTAWHQVTSWTPPRESYRLSEMLADVWRLSNLGRTIPTEVVTGGLLAAAACVVLSLYPGRDVTSVRQKDEEEERLPYYVRWGLLGFVIVVPIGLIFGLGLYREAYQKFLLVTAAPISLLVACGVVRGWQIAGGRSARMRRAVRSSSRVVVLILVAVFLIDTGRSLYNLYYDAEYVRADYRAIAQHILRNARPGDAIILNAPNQWEVFTYYYPEVEHVFPLARQRPLDVSVNQLELEKIAAEHRRLYAVFWGDAESDPSRFIESWLEAQTYKARETWYGDVRLAVYAVPGQVAHEPALPLDVRLERMGSTQAPAIFLDGYTLVNASISPGDILQLALFWHVEEPVSDRYKVFVHLYDENGQLVAQTDSEPGATLRPTNTWVPGQQITDRYGVLIPETVPEGTYTLAVGMYDFGDPDSRLNVIHADALVGDRLKLAEIAIRN